MIEKICQICRVMLMFAYQRTQSVHAMETAASGRSEHKFDYSTYPLLTTPTLI